jgi:hypothetical protein
MEKLFDFLKKRIEIILIVTLIMTIVSPLLFTRHWSNIDFSETGSIGDTIGGLTAPFLNFLSIILLYLTLREQTTSTRRQKDFDSVNGLFNIVKTDFENINLYQNDHSCYTGTRAIFEMRNVLLNCSDISTCLDEPSLRAFNLSFTFLISNVNQLLKKNFEVLTDKEDKQEIYTSLQKFKTPIDMLITASGIYFQKRQKIDGGKSVTELDKLVGMIYLVKKPLDDEFKKYEIK